MQHGKDPDLPPPFGSGDNNNKKGNDVKTFKRVELGKDDKEPLMRGETADMESGGMIMGPGHPIFDTPSQAPPSNLGVLPQGAVPPGARFDPITPVGPYRGEHGEVIYPSGEPDPDELPPPGGSASNPLQPGYRPLRPRQGGSDKGPFGGFSGGGAPFF